MNEAETRAEHTDPALAASGWGGVEGSRIRREYPPDLGKPEQIAQVFTGFQRYLYEREMEL